MQDTVNHKPEWSYGRRALHGVFAANRQAISHPFYNIRDRFLENFYTLPLYLLLLLVLSSAAAAVTNTADLDGVGIDEKLGEYIPSELIFYDQDAKRVEIADFFQDGRPVILSLNYYECPLLCTYILNGVLDAVNGLDSLSLGGDFKIVSVSFNPAETPELARAKSQNYYNSLKKSASKSDWHFLTGDQESIHSLTSSVGFRYIKDGKEFAHPSALIVLTPDMKISRYLYGAQYESANLRLALLEASNGKIGPSEILNRVLLFCYQFDPVGKKYALQAIKIMKAGGMVTLTLVAGLMFYYWRKEREQSK